VSTNWYAKTGTGLCGRNISYYGVHGLALMTWPDAEIRWWSKAAWWAHYWVLRAREAIAALLDGVEWRER
jgi:hypothetical protein